MAHWTVAVAAVLDEDDFAEIYPNVLIILPLHLSFLLDFGLRDLGRTV